MKLHYSDCTYSGKDHELNPTEYLGIFERKKNESTVILVMWIILFCSAILSIALINFPSGWQYDPGAELRDPQESHTGYPLADETVGTTETLQCRVLGTVS